jgi:hypothetical protein
MVLETLHERTAKWQDDTWVVTDKPFYVWQGKTKRSPVFFELSDALAWIIAHDEQQAQGLRETKG